MSGVACHHRLWTCLHSWIASDVACYHRPWTANTVERRRVWHAIIAIGQHRQSDGVGHGMPSSPLGNTDGRTASGVACHHRPWTTHTVERRRAWHTIIAIRQHTRSNDVGHGKTSPPLDSTHGRTTSGVACHHRLWEAQTVERFQAWHAIVAIGKHTRSNDIWRGMQSSPLGSTHGRTTLGVACHHRLWAAHRIE